MANNTLQWIFALRDRMSQPARSIVGALKQVEGASERVKQSVDLSEFSLKRIGTRWTELRAKIDLARMAWGYLRESVQGKLEAAMFGESTEVSLRVLLGSTARAQQALRATIGFAAKLPITTQEAIGAVTAFSAAGFKQGEMPKLLAAMSDIAAFNPADPESARRAFVFQMADMKQIGVQMRHLQYLAMEAKIPLDKVFEALGHAFGVKGEANVRKLISEHVVDWAHARDAIYYAIASKEGGHLGQLSYDLSQTLPGLMSTLRSRFLETFIGLKDTKGYAAIKGFVANLAALFDPNSAFGSQLKAKLYASFDRVFGGLVGPLSGSDGLRRLQNVALSALDGFDRLSSSMASMASTAAAIGGGIGDLVKGVHALGSGGDLALVAAGLTGIAGPLGVVTAGFLAWKDALDDVERLLHGDIATVAKKGGALGDVLYRFLHPDEGVREDIASFRQKRIAADFAEMRAPATTEARRSAILKDLQALGVNVTINFNAPVAKEDADHIADRVGAAVTNHLERIATTAGAQ